VHVVFIQTKNSLSAGTHPGPPAPEIALSVLAEIVSIKNAGEAVQKKAFAVLNEQAT
jgi:xanthine/CO dehydrogenase XdhC/CoxF family maturation factor